LNAQNIAAKFLNQAQFPRKTLPLEVFKEVDRTFCPFLTTFEVFENFAKNGKKYKGNITR
jgi:hypothetical protein